MKKLLVLSFLLLTLGIGLVSANPPGTFQPLLLNTSLAPKAISLQSSGTGTGGATPTATLATGTAQSNSCLVAFIGLDNGGGSTSALTIGGIPATLINSVTSGGNISIAGFQVNGAALGGSLSIVGVASGVPSGSFFSIYRITNILSCTPNNSGNNPGTGAQSINLSTLAAGVLAGAVYMNVATSASWTNAIKDYDVASGRQASGASANNTSAGTTNVTVTPAGGGPTTQAYVAASW